VPERRAALDGLHAWLVETGLAGTAARALFDGFCAHLVAAGVPLARAFFSTTALHPQRRASSVLWQAGQPATDLVFAWSDMQTATWRESPFAHMLERRAPRLRRRLVGPDAVVDFPVLSELRDAGLTDWFALVYGFGWAGGRPTDDALGVVLSYATARPAGFEAADLDALEEVSRTLALAAKASGTLDTARDVLATYLGSDPAARVIAGHVQRGAVGRMAAFILYADLRGFTDFTEVTPPEEVARRLNAYFDCAGAAIAARGGEILKFLGDGVLAVFLPAPGRDPASVGAASLAAARELLARVADLNRAETAAGNPALEVDVALHTGEITYGNVGTAERLDFTVIGPAVNEAARLEALCGALGRHLLVSDAVVRAAPAMAASLRSLGRHALRGVREPREVFGIAADT
jgi:adenylate cyclase